MANGNSRRGDTGSGYARYIGVGFTFISILGVLIGAGWLVDSLLGTLPLFLLVGVAVGFAGGLYYVYLILQKLENG